MKIRQISLQTQTIGVESASYVTKLTGYFISIKEILSDIFRNFNNMVLNFVRRSSSIDASGSGIGVKKEKKFKFPSFNKKVLGGIFAVVSVPLLFYAGSKLLQNSPDQQNNDGRVEVKGAKADTDLRRVFEFPLNNSEGEEISKIQYEIERAELRDEIITEGKRATAVKGRMFLILILKITNQYDKAIKINTRDYVRLSANGNEGELLAPETHNDPVEIQAISTKFTRVGFIVNDSDTNFILHVGQIKGDKEKVDLDLK